MHTDGERAAVASFATVALAVAANPVAVRFSNRELDPLWGVSLRFAIASAMLAVMMGVLRLAVPRGAALAGCVLFGALNYALALGLTYYALVELHAGVGQVLFALTPLATLLLAVVQRQEPLRARALLGAALALAGVAFLTEAPASGSLPLLPLLALLGAVVAVAQAAVVVRHFPTIHPVTMNTLGSATGLALLVPVSLLAGDAIELPQRGATWLAMGYLVLIAQILLPVLYLVVLGYWPASRVAYVFVITPFLTIALSAWLDDEPVGAGLVVGGVIVLAAVYLGALRPRPTPVAAVPP